MPLYFYCAGVLPLASMDDGATSKTNFEFPPSAFLAFQPYAVAREHPHPLQQPDSAS